MRRVFFGALFRQLGVVWPILSGVLLVMIAPGLLIGYMEGWRIDDALYFTFVTGLTIGYGDLTPHHVVIAHPTVVPVTVREAAALVERRGARLVEAPFTGSKLAAEKGQLVYYERPDMSGGAEPDN